MNPVKLWDRYQRFVCPVPDIGFQLDISRMMFDDDYLTQMAEPMSRALAAMDRLEQGAVANVDENRQVGHYWLRAPELAPDPATRGAIEQTVTAVTAFADNVHAGRVKPQREEAFYIVLVVGIGGSALGPQFVSDALGTTDDPIIVRFLDNTDPDGIDRTLAELDEALAQTLTVVVSKSGGTKETRNGMIEATEAYRRGGLSFPAHAVAVTCDGSPLHQKAVSERWLGTFPMWDWVGGRTSVLSAVGLLPAALQGFDIAAMLAGARACDAATRNKIVEQNPAALLALMWYYAGGGHGTRNMVVLPYRDRLALLGRYLQQLVMESLGKGRTRAGDETKQGLTVYGNKGSTDQHAYVQQLRDGRNDFFVTFLNVRRDRDESSIRVEEDVTTGDYLGAFWQGTRAALNDNGRESLTITLDRLDARSVGALIALFERAVGLYAELIDINAYDQPGVEAGKKAAGAVLDLQRKVLAHLRGNPGPSCTAEEIAAAVGAPDAVEDVYHVLEHAVANPDHNVSADASPSRATPADRRYRAI
jgi:glucose-6-phosphate isomerase